MSAKNHLIFKELRETAVLFLGEVFSLIIFYDSILLAHDQAKEA